MKRILPTLLVLLATMTALAAQESVEVRGNWNMTVDTSQGPLPVALAFAAVEEGKIRGVLSSMQGDLTVTGTISGTAITFTGEFNGNGQSVLLKFTGKVAGDTMSGDADFGGMGGGTWSAKRAN